MWLFQEAASHLLTEDNQLLLYQFDPASGKRIFKMSDCQPGAVQMRALTLALGLRYFLGTDQSAYFCDGDASAPVKASFADPAGWRQIEGGLFYADLYGVSNAGQIKVWDEESKSTKPAEMEPPGPVVKYLEGISFRAALLEDNSLSLRSWDGKTNVTFKINHPRKIVDMAITRRYFPQEKFHAPWSSDAVPLIAALKTNCGAKKVFPGLWNQDPVGLNAQGQLGALKGGTGGCRTLDLSRMGLTNAGISDVRLEGTDNSSNDKNVSEPFLSFVQDGNAVPVRPYFFRR